MIPPQLLTYVIAGLASEMYQKLRIKFLCGDTEIKLNFISQHYPYISFNQTFIKTLR